MFVHEQVSPTAVRGSSGPAHPNHPKLGETGLGKRGADLRRTCGHRLRSPPTALSLTPLRHLQEAGGAHFMTELLRNRARKLIVREPGMGREVLGIGSLRQDRLRCARLRPLFRARVENDSIRPFFAVCDLRMVKLR